MEISELEEMRRNLKYMFFYNPELHILIGLRAPFKKKAFGKTERQSTHEVYALDLTNNQEYFRFGFNSVDFAMEQLKKQKCWIRYVGIYTPNSEEFESLIANLKIKIEKNKSFKPINESQLTF